MSGFVADLELALRLAWLDREALEQLSGSKEEEERFSGASLLVVLPALGLPVLVGYLSRATGLTVTEAVLGLWAGVFVSIVGTGSMLQLIAPVIAGLGGDRPPKAFSQAASIATMPAFAAASLGWAAVLFQIPCDAPRGHTRVIVQASLALAVVGMVLFWILLARAFRTICRLGRVEAAVLAAVATGPLGAVVFEIIARLLYQASAFDAALRALL